MFDCNFRVGRKKSVIVALAVAGVFCSVAGGLSSLDSNDKSMSSFILVTSWSYSSVMLYFIEAGVLALRYILSLFLVIKGILTV